MQFGVLDLSIRYEYERISITNDVKAKALAEEGWRLVAVNENFLWFERVAEPK